MLGEMVRAKRPRTIGESEVDAVAKSLQGSIGGVVGAGPDAGTTADANTGTLAARASKGAEDMMLLSSLAQGIRRARRAKANQKENKRGKELVQVDMHPKMTAFPRPP